MTELSAASSPTALDEMDGGEDGLLPCPFCGAAVRFYDGDTVQHPDDGSGCILAADYCDLAKWQVRALTKPTERSGESR